MASNSSVLCWLVVVFALHEGVDPWFHVEVCTSPRILAHAVSHDSFCLQGSTVASSRLTLRGGSDPTYSDITLNAERGNGAGNTSSATAESVGEDLQRLSLKAVEGGGDSVAVEREEEAAKAEPKVKELERGGNNVAIERAKEAVAKAELKVDVAERGGDIVAIERGKEAVAKAELKVAEVGGNSVAIERTKEAVARAELKVDVAVAKAELKVAERGGNSVAIARAKEAVAKAELKVAEVEGDMVAIERGKEAVAKAELEVAEVGGNSVAIARGKEAVAKAELKVDVAVAKAELKVAEVGGVGGDIVAIERGKEAVAKAELKVAEVGGNSVAIERTKEAVARAELKVDVAVAKAELKVAERGGNSVAIERAKEAVAKADASLVRGVAGLPNGNFKQGKSLTVVDGDAMKINLLQIPKRPAADMSKPNGWLRGASVLPNTMVYPPADIKLIECNDHGLDHGQVSFKSLKALRNAKVDSVCLGSIAENEGATTCGPDQMLPSVRERSLQALIPFFKELNLTFVGDKSKTEPQGSGAKGPNPSIQALTLDNSGTGSEATSRSKPDISIFVPQVALHRALGCQGTGAGICAIEYKKGQGSGAFRQASGEAITFAANLVASGIDLEDCIAPFMTFTGQAIQFGAVRTVESFNVTREGERSTILLPVVATFSPLLILDDEMQLEQAAQCLTSMVLWLHHVSKKLTSRTQTLPSRRLHNCVRDEEPGTQKLGFLIRKPFKDLLQTFDTPQDTARNLWKVLCGLPRDVFQFIAAPIAFYHVESQPHSCEVSVSYLLTRNLAADGYHLGFPDCRHERDLWLLGFKTARAKLNQYAVHSDLYPSNCMYKFVNGSAHIVIIDLDTLWPLGTDLPGAILQFKRKACSESGALPKHEDIRRAGTEMDQAFEMAYAKLARNNTDFQMFIPNSELCQIYQECEYTTEHLAKDDRIVRLNQRWRAHGRPLQIAQLGSLFEKI